MINYVGKMVPVLLTALISPSALAQEGPAPGEDITEGTGMVCYTASGWGTGPSGTHVTDPITDNGSELVIKRCQGQLRDGSNVNFNKSVSRSNGLDVTDSLTVTHPDGSVEAYVDRDNGLGAEACNAATTDSNYINQCGPASASLPVDRVTLYHPGNAPGNKAYEVAGDREATRRYLDLIRQIDQAPTFLGDVRKEIRTKIIRRGN